MSKIHALARAAAATAAACLLAPAAVPAEPIGTWRSSYDWTVGDGYAGWTPERDAPDDAAYGLSAGLGDVGGLWSWLTGDHEYRPGSAGWRLRAPRTTHLASARLALKYRDKLFAHHCLDLRLARDAAALADRRDCAPPADGTAGTDGTSRLDATLADADATATDALISVVMPPCRNPSDAACSKWIPQLDPLHNGAATWVTSADLVFTDDDAPSVQATGPFRNLDDQYVDGQQRYDLAIHATDSGSGVAHLGLARLPDSAVERRDADCDPRHRTAALGAAVCPDAADATLSVDTAGMPEGRLTFAATTSDLAARTALSDTWAVRIDRTGPGAPSEVQADDDDEDDEAVISWTPGYDPDLPDGTPGSGIGAFWYRWAREGEPLGEWQETDAAMFTAPGVHVGDRLTVAIRPFDVVENAGTELTTTLTVADDEPCTPGDDPLEYVDADVHDNLLGPGSPPVTAFTVADDLTEGELLAALPDGAQLASVIERTPPLGGDMGHESQLGFAGDVTAAANLRFYGAYLRDDAEEDLDMLSQLRDEATSARMRATLDGQMSAIRARLLRYNAAGGPMIKSFAIVRDAEVEQQIEDRLAGNLVAAPDDADPESAVDPCFPDAGDSPATTRAAASPRSAPVAHAASNPIETGFGARSWAPKRVILGTDSFYDPPESARKASFRRMVMRFQFGDNAHRRYWLHGHRRTDMPRGWEMQAVLDLDAAHDRSWGAPLWGDGAPPNGKLRGPTKIWDANFLCAYPDDYESDDFDNTWTPTIGSYCRPFSELNPVSANRYWFRWSMLLDRVDTDGRRYDDVDRIGVSVEPVHLAQKGHTFPATGPDPGERLCVLGKPKRVGSCMFRDHHAGNATYTYPGATVTDDRAGMHYFRTTAR